MKNVLYYAFAISIIVTGCHQKNSAVEKVAKQKLPEFLITTLDTVPGWSITETQGLNCRIFQYTGAGDYMDTFQENIAAITEDGKKIGANAFVNLTIASESHEIQGSKWHASIIHICGDFVTLK